MAFGASRYHVLLAFGLFYLVGAQLASVSVVLPFLLAQKGIFWAAGLLYPTFSIGFISGNVLSPLVVDRSRRRQNLVIATAAATIAALTSCTAAAGLRDVLVAPVFLVASLVIGCVMGMADKRLRRDHFTHARQKATQSITAQPGSGRCGSEPLPT